MTRREFSKQVKRQAFERSGGYCEGENCGAFLTAGKFAYDHIIPDAMGGEPTLHNCAVLCNACHGEKTGKQDMPRIAKVKRIQDREKGIRKPSRLQSRGFEKVPRQHSASRPLERTR